MTILYAKSVLTPSGWQNDVRLTLSDGQISNIEIGVSASQDDERHDVIVPAMPNLHSHAFQRAMTGLAEMRGDGADSFWSWRTNMYRFALTMTPDDIEAVASQLYIEMLEAGFCRVGEFHYLHHNIDGQAYENIAENAGRIAGAATTAGIDLTLLPVFYAHSGFGGTAPVEGQRRFINSVAQYARLHEKCREIAASVPGMVVGVAPHSLRAATPDELAEIVEIAGDNPVHIHIAEQVKEVEDCVAWSGRRPVEWLYDHMTPDEKWCLVHATHMTDAETLAMAQSGAVAGLCPITEANLGDGTFPMETFRNAGGHFGIGSDSNVQIDTAAELRQLEYSQRLHHKIRNAVADTNSSTGRTLFDGALRGGAQALACDVGIKAGVTANLVSLNTDDVSYLRGDHLLDAWIFGGIVKPADVWVRGIKQVRDGAHIQRKSISNEFQKVMGKLLKN